MKTIFLPTIDWKYFTLIIGTWMLSITFLLLFRDLILNDKGLQQLTLDFNPYNFIVSILVGGSLFGLTYFFIDYYFDDNYAHQKPYYIVLIFKIFSTILFLIIISFITRTLHYLFAENSMYSFQEAALESFSRLFSYFQIVIYFWVFLWIVGLNAIKIIEERLIRGQLYNIFTGVYHKPQPEDRIFMFLDMKSSTTYAEQLGHVKYSQLLQDCFFDLDKSIRKYQADIYKYIGDGVALTWRIPKGVKRNNCLHLYFDFLEILEKRQHYYLKEYGIRPRFKVGIHAGTVTIAEVGSIRKEIAYHGNVLNMTSRIEEQCNTLSETFLISGYLLNLLDYADDFRSSFIGSVPLRGLKEKVDIYTVVPK